jgi:hypothetical protein
MTGPPAAQPETKTSLRRDEKRGRAFEGGGAVRVVSEGNYLVMRLHPTCDAQQIDRLLAAPNAEPLRTHSGRLVGIRLLSFGDERGHSGEGHGSSIITTQRLQNDNGILIGGHRTLKHKAENANHGSPPPTWVADTTRGCPVQAPLAAKR